VRECQKVWSPETSSPLTRATNRHKTFPDLATIRSSSCVSKSPDHAASSRVAVMGSLYTKQRLANFEGRLSTKFQHDLTLPSTHPSCCAGSQWRFSERIDAFQVNPKPSPQLNLIKADQMALRGDNGFFGCPLWRWRSQASSFSLSHSHLPDLMPLIL